MLRESLKQLLVTVDLNASRNCWRSHFLSILRKFEPHISRLMAAEIVDVYVMQLRPYRLLTQLAVQLHYKLIDPALVKLRRNIIDAAKLRSY